MQGSEEYGNLATDLAETNHKDEERAPDRLEERSEHKDACLIHR